MGNVERIELAPGLEISRVLTGLWQVADMERDGGIVDTAAAAAEMRRYVDIGLTTFDMADHYGSSEVIAGHFAAGAPDEAQFLTKWVPKPGPHSLEDVRTAVETARSRLQADTIDVLQFHAWSYSDPAWLDCMFYLQDLRDEGLIRHLALTNADTAHLRMLLDSGIEIVSKSLLFAARSQSCRGDGRVVRGEGCQDSGVWNGGWWLL